jgi:hypothetical protein
MLHQKKKKKKKKKKELCAPFFRLVLDFKGNVDWCWGMGGGHRGHVVRRIVRASGVAEAGTVLTALVIVCDPSHADYKDGNSTSYHGCEYDCGHVRDRVGYEAKLHGVGGVGRECGEKGFAAGGCECVYYIYFLLIWLYLSLNFFIFSLPKGV